MMCQSGERSRIPFDLIKQIAAIIDSGRMLNNRGLLATCRDWGIDGLATDPHLCHEVAETALNYLIAIKYGKQLLSSDDPRGSCAEILRPLQQRLPTQSWRSAAQVTYQQFSTPAPIAYLAAHLLNLSRSDSVLEPSCGTGSLAVWARAAGSAVVTNEIDSRRRQLAGLIGFDPTGYDAEFIDDFLPENISPNVVFANPPFSSSGGRVERNQNKFGLRHVESALRRLESGGRFAVILGEGGSPRSVSGRMFWNSLRPGIRVTRSISIPGREYYRNGTTVGVTLILGYKLSVDKPQGDVLFNHEQSFDNVEKAFDERIRIAMNYQELHEAVKNGTIVGAVNANGKKIRFFVSDSGALCRFKPHSSRRGYCLHDFDLARYTQFISPKASPTGEEKLKREYRVIEKYKRMAGEASFTNPFIRDCFAIPDFDVWRTDLVEPNSWEKDREPRPKTLYELHVTTGTNIDGKVISLNRIAKKYPLAIERLRESVRNQSAGTFIIDRWAKFAGYDISLETDFDTGTGDFRGFLSLEYAGCGNGYYYLLINDETFIGYDVD